MLLVGEDLPPVINVNHDFTSIFTRDFCVDMLTTNLGSYELSHGAASDVPW